MSPEPVCIIGTGHAGLTLAREFRRLDASTPLLLLTEDRGDAYYKPDLSKAFAAGKDAAGLIKTARAELETQLQATILPTNPASSLQLGVRSVMTAGGPIAYRQLVLATGATPIRIPLAGDGADRVLSVNTLDDYAVLRKALTPGARVTILGAGLIGCEFANDLAAAGFAVTVADLLHWPLARLMPQAQGQALQAALERLGVRFVLGQSAEAVHADGAAFAVQFKDGATVAADVVISAVGLAPNTGLARAAGIAVAPGIVVNDYLQTSAPDVFALGDCAAIAGRALPYILPIAHGARALAATLAGNPTRAVMPAMPVMVKTPALPTLLCPAAPMPGTWTVKGDGEDLAGVFRDEQGRPQGYALTGKACAQRAVLTASMPPVLA